MSVGALIQALQGLCEQEDNALPEFPIVVRVDLGPEQEFRVTGVSVENPGEFEPGRDLYVVIEAGSSVLGDPWTDPDSEDPSDEARWER